MHTAHSTTGWRQRALAVMPVGSSTNSKAPTLLPEEPEVIVRGHGCRVWDDRGREFIDYRCALGPVTLGYADPTVDAAIRAQLDDGILFGHPHPLETTTAELFCSLVPGAEAARFLKTGGEALAAVIRIARAHTGRDRVVQIGYNGWLNSLAAGARVLPGATTDAV
ncbi:aminotransferase class III-fold pyridoxal phosphate-dependent enzyme, partial [Microbacterium sp. AGC62]